MDRYRGRASTGDLDTGFELVLRFAVRTDHNPTSPPDPSRCTCSTCANPRLRRRCRPDRRSRGRSPCDTSFYLVARRRLALPAPGCPWSISSPMCSEKTSVQLSRLYRDYYTPVAGTFHVGARLRGHGPPFRFASSRASCAPAQKDVRRPFARDGLRDLIAQSVQIDALPEVQIGRAS